MLKSYELEAGIGKDIELVATLVNKGSETSSTGTATLVCNDQYVNIVSGSADFGAIAAKGETTVTFIVNLSATIPTNDVLNFDVEVEYTSTGVTTQNYEYTFEEDFDGWSTYSQESKSRTWEWSSGLLKSYSYNGGNHQQVAINSSNYMTYIGSSQDAADKAKISNIIYIGPDAVGIRTADELVEFATLVNSEKDYSKFMNMSGVVTLLADIDMSGKTWTPIGNATHTLSSNKLTVTPLLQGLFLHL